MRKNILNEINDMKYLFAYKRGVVISEQEIFEDKNYDNEDYNYLKSETVDEEYDDLELSDPDVAEPETKPRTRPSKPDTDREDKPFNPGRPNRDPNRLPYEDPDTHPQGEDDDDEIMYDLEFSDPDYDDEIMYDLEFSDPDVAEPETKPRTRPSKPDTDREDKPFNPGRPNRDPNRLPYEDPDTHPQGALKRFIQKYMNSKK